MARRSRKAKTVEVLAPEQGHSASELIAERRQAVRRLYHMKARPAQIVSSLRKERPELLRLADGRDIADPLRTICDDVNLIKNEDVEYVSSSLGLPALASYVGGKAEVAQMALTLYQNPAIPPRDRLQALKLYGEAMNDIARASGVPVDAPAIQVNLLAQLIEGGIELPQGIAGALTAGTAGGAPLVGGMVDPLTFAVDRRFCGLPTVLDGYPMQERVLREFLPVGSGYRILILVCGMRSGKGVLGSIAAWYAAYELLSLEDPQAFFGLAPGQEIQILNTATSQTQAKDNVFKHIKDRLQHGGAWFENLRSQVVETGLELRLPKNIVIRCGHSRASGLVGGTSYMVIEDELARFKDTAGKDNADDVHEKLSATTATFRNRARVLVLSSPEWEGDKAMRLLEEAAETDEDGRPLRPHVLGLQLPTWEANLTLSEDYLWETFDGLGNPSAFWRDFGARPPHAVEAYYPDPERWERQADPERVDPYATGSLSADFVPCCDSRRFVHIDLGVTRDACGVALAHQPVEGCPWNKTMLNERGDIVDNPKAKRIVLDVAIQIKPPRQRETKGEISFERVRQIVRDWHDRGFKIKAGGVSYDGWQSLDSRQILKREGFRTEEYSLDRDTEGHDTLQELVNRDELSYYRHRVLIDEARHLQLVRGKKVDHPKGGSKDVVDAVAGAVYHALKRGGRMRFVG